MPDLLKQVGEVKKGGPILSRILRQLERGARLKLSLSCPLPFVTELLPGCHAADPGARPTFKDILRELGAAVSDIELMDGSLQEGTGV